MIIELSRGFLRVELNGKIVRILGELCFPEEHDFEFVVYLNSISQWERPHDAQDISDDEKQELIKHIQDEFSKKGRYVIFE